MLSVLHAVKAINPIRQNSILGVLRRLSEKPLGSLLIVCLSNGTVESNMAPHPFLDKTNRRRSNAMPSSSCDSCLKARKELHAIYKHYTDCRHCSHKSC